MTITRNVYLTIRETPSSAPTQQLEAEGWVLLEGVFAADEIAPLKREIENVYDALPADLRNMRIDAEEREDFRYEMLNRSGLAQAAIAHPRILHTIEPLLGEDCHVIANTCWRNPPREQNQHGGGFWHIDAGPHVPRPAGVPWDDRIPYPIFAIGAHIYLDDCPIECGPTGVIPGSHKSGLAPPRERAMDPGLTWEGRRVHVMAAKAGDVALFVSDVWHRRMPAGAGDRGRFFLQCHYGRRDLAQRLRTTGEVNQVTPEAMARAKSPRERTLIGLHAPFFYDG